MGQTDNSAHERLGHICSNRYAVIRFGRYRPRHMRGARLTPVGRTGEARHRIIGEIGDVPIGGRLTRGVAVSADIFDLKVDVDIGPRDLAGVGDVVGPEVDRGIEPSEFGFTGFAKHANGIQNGPVGVSGRYIQAIVAHVEVLADERGARCSTVIDDEHGGESAVFDHQSVVFGDDVE